MGDKTKGVSKMKLPELTQQPILHIDGTPDDNYALRILRAYREECNCRWAESTDGSEPTSPLLRLMNEHCDQRAQILDKAISTLEKERG